MTARKKTARKPKPVDVPLPGRAVRGSAGGRPIMAALDLLGRRWNLRILWELRTGPTGFRDLRARCDDMSPDTLSTRLAELQASGLITRSDETGASLTPLGRKLGPALKSLDRWAEDWAKAVE